MPTPPGTLQPSSSVALRAAASTASITVAVRRPCSRALMPWIVVPPAERAGWRVEREFAGAIRGEEPVRLTTFADGVRYMEFTEAVAVSARTGRRVELPRG